MLLHPLRLLVVMTALGLFSVACSSSSAGSSGNGQGDGGSSNGLDGGSAEAGCAADKVCGTACCGQFEQCAKDANGNAFCGVSCTGGSVCPMASPCCDPAPTGGKGGVCMADNQQTCICVTGKDCASSACAPAVDSSGHPTSTYVCVPNTGLANEGCNGSSTPCEQSTCCATDMQGNNFCATPCTGNSTCGGGHCDALTVSGAACSGMKVCGP